VGLILVLTTGAISEEKYQTIFRLSSKPVGRLREYCRLPFFLRIVSEVYANRSGGLPLDISEDELVESWLRHKRVSMSDPDAARLVSLAVAEAISAHASKTTQRIQQESVSEADLRRHAYFDVAIANELVSHGVLTRHDDEHQRVSFAFSYEKVRDYLIARHVLQLDKLEASEFGTRIDSLFRNGIHEEALLWHLRNATESHHVEIKKHFERRARLFTDTYNRIFDSVVPGIKPCVEPYTSGPIGLAYDLVDYQVQSYGFYAVGKRVLGPVIELHPEPNGGSWPFATALARIDGGRAYRRGSHFGNADPVRVAAHLAFDEIKQSLSDGRLDDAITIDLVIEAIIAICVRYRDKFRDKIGGFGDMLDPRVFPINAHELSNTIQAYFGEWHYIHQWIDDQIHPRVDDQRSPVHIDQNAVLEARSRARLEAEQGARFARPNVFGEEELYRLPELLRRLEEMGINEITKPVLPAPELFTSGREEDLPKAYSDGQISELIKEFFSKAISSYRSIVERNFPGVRNQFALYASLPVTVVVSYTRNTAPHQNRQWGHISYALMPTSNNEVSVEVYVDASEPIFPIPADARKWKDFQGRDVVCLHGTDLRSLLKPRGAGFGSRSGYSGSSAPLRGFAYAQLRSEIASLTADMILEAAKSL